MIMIIIIIDFFFIFLEYLCLNLCVMIFLNMENVGIFFIKIWLIIVIILFLSDDMFFLFGRKLVFGIFSRFFMGLLFIRFL